MKYNKLIAEFMGVYSKENGYDYTKIGNKGVSYHKSWDWLMPVIQKCRQENRLEYFDRVYYALEECDINVTYKAIVEFIKKQNN
jgi:hypothetical protein